MSTRKLKGFKLFLETIKEIEKVAKKFSQPDIRIIEVALDNFFAMKESEQKEAIKKFLTKDL